MATAPDPTKPFRVLALQPYITWAGSRGAVGDVVTFPAGAKPPLWGKVLPETDEKQRQEVLAALRKSSARPALATMSEINKANADLQSALSGDDGKAQTARGAAEALAKAEAQAEKERKAALAEIMKAAGMQPQLPAPADATPPAPAGDTTLEDLLR